jgi:hypothetical protein
VAYQYQSAADRVLCAREKYLGQIDLQLVESTRSTRGALAFGTLRHICILADELVLDQGSHRGYGRLGEAFFQVRHKQFVESAIHAPQSVRQPINQRTNALTNAHTPVHLVEPRF